MDGFKMVDDKIKEHIGEQTDLKSRIYVKIYNHLFSIVFTLLTISAIVDFSLNLKNSQLRTSLPIVLSAFLVIFTKLKYDKMYETPLSDYMPVPTEI